MPDVNVNENAGGSDASVRARIFLRNEPFTLRCNILGATTEEARAELIGVNYRTLYAARCGRPVGEKFVAGALSAFNHHADRFAAMNLKVTFEALFETAQTPAPAVAAVS